MTQAEFNAFCESLPHTSHVVQWGDADVWKIGGKVFSVGGWQMSERQRDKGDRPSALMRRARAGTEQNEAAAVSDKNSYCVTFKCSPTSFDILREQPGCRPAPYLASRGMKWIQRTSDESMDDAALKDYLRESYRLVSLNLTKKLQKELGLNGAGGDAA